MSTEAAVLKRKKTTISKGTIKKTIKNVICRPDAVYWPAVTEAEGKELETILHKYRVSIPEFKKPHWKDIKCLPKSERPKQPPVKRVEGLVFGLSECRNLVENQQLAALILENEVIPRAIVHPLLEECHKTSVPVLCMTSLKKITADNFGIATSCLGIKLNILTDLTNKIIEISRKHKPNKQEMSVVNVTGIEKDEQDIEMKESIDNTKIESEVTSNVLHYPYLYRTDKKRVFIPPNIQKEEKTSKDFIGQDFIAISSINVNEGKAYKKMIVKRISNNPNRVKVK
ncbi:hypothetical protein RR46_04863 [Papilio xuthus]|uniref:Ribosomal protein L7Ae/L30e/S12e/Gadd45 domain-containing protein n=1 Tax=Papilio xuthus TaxID=66420 RepID=A0A194Q4F2_PAPXU|nr:hypothetical protein RR46_04863 [Papilio xuthus]